MKIFILLTLLIQLGACLPAIPATYIYENSKGALYVGTTNNLARRAKEHIYANHKYANSQLSYWDMTGKTVEQRYSHEKKIISMRSPKYNKIAGGNGPRIKTDSFSNLLDSNRLGIPISTRELIGTAAALWYEYKEITEMYKRQKKFLKGITAEYEIVRDETKALVENIAKYRNRLYKEKEAVIRVIKHIKDYSRKKINSITKSISIKPLRKDLISSVNSHKKKIIKLKEKIEKRVADEKAIAAASVVGTIWLNLIIPGFTLIEGIAVGATMIKLEMVLKFANICNGYIDDLDKLYYLLSLFS